MFRYFNQNKSQEEKLYNKIISLSRNKLFYTIFGLSDTFQNRINLIFLHISFLFIKIRQDNKNQTYNKFNQKMFDYIFKNIELNIREIGYSDTMVNKSMKSLVKIFYNILLNCENYKKKTSKYKNLFLLKYLTIDNKKKSTNNIDLVNYFDKYQTFCLDLSSDSVLKGDLNFTYK